MQKKEEKISFTKFKWECIQIFSKLIGDIEVLLKIKSYENYCEEYAKILKIIKKWSNIALKKEDLSFISREELLKIYEDIESMRDTIIFDKNFGYESELSDEIYIWYWNLMHLRKKQIEGNVINE